MNETIAASGGEVVLPDAAGFWPRVGAYAVDLTVLCLVCFGIRLALGDHVFSLGNWGRLLGLAVGLAYFGPMNSRLTGGRSLGKRALGLRVLRRDGALLTPLQSTLRALYLLVPAALNGIMFPSTVYAETGMPAWLGWAIDISLGLVLFVIVFGGVLSSAVLFLSDAKWRRGLHDLLAGTVVVRTGIEGPPPAPSVTRLRMGAAVAAPVAVVVALFLVVSAGFPSFTELQRSVAQVEAARDSVVEAWPGSTVFAQLTFGLDKEAKDSTLVINAWLAHQPGSLQVEAEKMVALVQEKHPDLAGGGFLAVTAISGYDLLFWSKREAYRAVAERAPWPTLKDGDASASPSP